MKNLKVIKIESDVLIFNSGTRLFSNHVQDCCENHYLDFEDLDLIDFEGLEFDLTNDDFFNRVKDYGIELKPIEGHVVRIPGYGYNNGYYSSNIDLIVADANGNIIKSYDVSECQNMKNARITYKKQPLSAEKINKYKKMTSEEIGVNISKKLLEKLKE